jgi:peptidoglycan/LPS O-acetylase OafA/YrhL
MDSGVAVFFVISGFLIYRPFVLAHFRGDEPMRTRSFFWRRALRILPAYWLVLSFLWAMGAFSLGSNWWKYYLLIQTYWRDTVVRGGVLQAWSLCTEISFYLMIPLFSLAVRRLFGRNGGRTTAARELAAVGVLYVGGFVARALISANDPLWRGSSFQWLPTNLDLFASGMALAVVSVWAVHDRRVRAFTDRLGRAPGLWWAAAIALFAWYAYRVGPPVFNTGYTGFFWQQRQFVVTLVAVLLLVPAVFGAQDRGLVRRGLQCRPVVWVGLMSYGLYLWHFDWIKRVPAAFDPDTGAMRWPGWVHSRPLDTNVFLLLAAGMGLGLLFAAISWYGLERPLQRFKRLF